MIQRIVVLILIALAIPVTAQAVYDLPPSRKITWQGNVGVPGDIPTRTTICATLSAPGTTDAAPLINNAITACSTNGVVKLDAGTFFINSAIKVQRSNIVLRGSGMGVTTLKARQPYTGFETDGILDAQGSGHRSEMDSPPPFNLASGYTKGSTQVVTSSAHNYSAGQVVVIDQVNDPNADPPVTCNGTEGCSLGLQGRGAPTASPFGTGRSEGMVNRIASVVNATTLNLELPLLTTYTASRTPQIIGVSGMVTNVGFEDLTVDCRVLNTTTYVNEACVTLTDAADSWLLRVEGWHGDSLANTGKGMFRGFHAYRCTVRSSYFHGDRIGGSDSYGILLGAWVGSMLFEDTIVLDRPFVITGVTSGNVFAYNYVHAENIGVNGTRNKLAFNYHGAEPTWNLVEGNWIEGYTSIDTSAHGPAANNTFHRNRIVSESGATDDRIIIDQEFFSWYINHVGNVYGVAGQQNRYKAQTPGEDVGNDNSIYQLGYPAFNGSPNPNANGGVFDTQVAPKTLFHGNWDAVNQGVRYCDTVGETGCFGGSADHTIPTSFYLTIKPSYFGSCAWPVYGPEGNPTIGTLPAKDRASGGTACASGGDVTPPSVPANLRVTSFTTNRVNLAWDASTDDTAVTGYLVERVAGGVCSGFSQIGTTANLAYSDIGILTSTSYCYRVRATDAANNLSSYSSNVSQTTDTVKFHPTLNLRRINYGYLSQEGSYEDPTRYHFLARMF